MLYHLVECILAVILALVMIYLFDNIWSAFFGDSLDFLKNVLLLAILALCSCQKKSPDKPVQTIIYGDTARIRLVHRADSTGGKALTIVHQHAQNSVTTHEEIVNEFDSIQVTLP